jgi:DNA primase
MAAEKSGLELREVRARRDAPDPRMPVWEVTGAAQDWFRRILWDDPSGAPAREYLAQRDITQEAADRFGLGFAPRDAGLMRAHLTALGFDDQRQLDAGLLVRREDSEELRPRFRGRLVFPIHDLGGSVAGFGGRVLGQGEPKYLNSAESIAFSKGKLLYGLNWARNAIRRAERVLLVEGYFDLVRLVVAGIEEVVAPLGTALTAEQAGLVTRYSKNVFLLYDSDRAGLKATFRAGDELLRQGASVRVVTLPEGEDPDTFVRQQGRAALERQLAESIDVFERKIQLLQRGAWFADLHRRRRAIDHLLPTIRAAADPVTRDMYIGRAAQASGVDRRVLTDEAAGNGSGRGGRRAVRRAAAEAAPAPVAARRREPRAAARAVPGTAAERDLVRAMLTARPVVERVVEQIGPREFRDPRYREIFEVLARLGPDATNDEIAGSLSEETVSEFGRPLEKAASIENVDQTVRDCLNRLARRHFEERNAEIRRLLGAARGAETDVLMREQMGNKEEIRRLSGETPGM